MGIKPWVFWPFVLLLVLPERSDPPSKEGKSCSLFAGGSTWGLWTPFLPCRVTQPGGSPALGLCSSTCFLAARTGHSSPHGAKAATTSARLPGAHTLVVQHEVGRQEEFCLGRCRSHRPGTRLRKGSTWHSVPRSGRHRAVRSEVGLDDVRGVFQADGFCNSEMKAPEARPGSTGVAMAAVARREGGACALPQRRRGGAGRA